MKFKCHFSWQVQHLVADCKSKETNSRAILYVFADCQGDVFSVMDVRIVLQYVFLVKFCMSLRTAGVMLPRHALRGIADKRGCEGIADRECHEHDVFDSTGVVLCSREHDVFYSTGVVLCSTESYSIFEFLLYMF